MKSVFEMKRTILALAAASMLMAGCSEENTETPATPGATDRIEVAGAPEAPLAASGDEFTVTVQSSGDWRLAGKKEWCHPDLTEGADGAEVRFTVDENPGYEARSVVYTFMSGGKSCKLTVSQQGGVVVEAERDRYEVAAAGGEFRIRIDANVALAWELDPSSSEWLSDTTPETRAGMPERSYVYLTVAENTTYAAREGVLRVTGEGAGTREITIAQLQNDAILIDADSYPVEPEGGEVAVQVDANVDYTVEIPSEAASWCRHTASEEVSGEGPLRRTVEKFEIDESSMTRNVVVVLRAVGGEVKAEVNISQIVESEAAIVDVPDANFRNFLLQKGYVVTADGTKCQLTDAGMELTSMNCSGLDIESLAGIEGFTKLESLDFTDNLVKKVDLSANTLLSDLKFETNPVEEMNLGDAPVMLVDISATKLQVGDNWWDMVYPSKFTLISSQPLEVKAGDNCVCTKFDMTQVPNLKRIDVSYITYSGYVVYLKRGVHTEDVVYRGPVSNIVIEWVD